VFLCNVSNSQKQHPHLQGTPEKSEIYVKVCLIQDAKRYVTKELWELCIIDCGLAQLPVLSPHKSYLSITLQVQDIS
jgi:hypothetical protein